MNPQYQLNLSEDELNVLQVLLNLQENGEQPDDACFDYEAFRSLFNRVKTRDLIILDDD